MIKNPKTKFLKSNISKLNILLILYLLFLVANILLAGRFWLWNLTSFIPSFLFLIMSFLLFGILVITHEKIINLIVLILILFLSFGISDLNLSALTYSKDNSNENQIKVFNFNTEFWEQPETITNLYKFLKNQEADIYLLQEHTYVTSEGFETVNDFNDLKVFFPSFEIYVAGEFVTISRFPMKSCNLGNLGGYLKCEIVVQDQTVSFYNVHIPIHFTTKDSNFLNGVRLRFNLREKILKELRQAIENDPNKFIISGDFNTSRSMGSMNMIKDLGNDAAKSSKYLVPTTWGIGDLNFWRIDWVISSKDLEVNNYQEVSAKEYSDHKGIKFELGL